MLCLPAATDPSTPCLPTLQEGHWEDVSGETFLRRLMSMPLEETRWSFYGALRPTLSFNQP